jgi:hypothetical protein
VFWLGKKADIESASSRGNVTLIEGLPLELMGLVQRNRNRLGRTGDRQFNLLFIQQARQPFDHLKRDREDDRGVLLHADLRQRLQIAQLECDRFCSDGVGRANQLLGRLISAFGVDDLPP